MADGQQAPQSKAANVRNQIAAMLLSPVDSEKISDEWLRHLHTSYVQRYLADNDRTWSTASFIFPISLAGFAAIVAVTDFGFVHVVVVGTAASLLMFFWYLVAGIHLAYSRRSYHMVRAIEICALTEERELAIRKVLTDEAPDRNLKPQALRFFFLIATTLAWIALALTVYLDEHGYLVVL
jgi:hypothetical protein